MIKENHISRIILTVLITLFNLSLINIYAQVAKNPVIWADVPDVSTIRVGDTYYMSSTTMHMSPGLPIMKSKDLVNWEIAGYAYDRLVENDKMNLENGQEAYGKGSWASSLRYHNGIFYVSTFSATSGKTHVYKTKNIETEPWEAFSFEPVLHDNSLFFDDDGKVYMLYGGGTIKLVELLPDASGIKPNGIEKVIIDNVNLVFGKDEVGGLPGEGCQIRKINGKYYLFNIASPKSHWARTVIVHRADKITGPYEGRVVLQDQHIAQGGLIDTPDGNWYAMLFGDRGSVGRIPYLVPVKWENDWPILGTNGKVPETLDLPDNSNGIFGIVASDEFERKENDPKLPLAWQWNHNPDNKNWAILENPGRLRITTGRVDKSILFAKNTLTQRTFGPKSSATTLVNVSEMKNGDVAGLIAFQNKFGYVGVKKENDKMFIVMTQSRLGFEDEDQKQGIKMINKLSESFKEIEQIPLHQENVYFKIDCDFETDEAYFYYSLDGEKWQKIGNTLNMVYTFTKHFMGYRFGLFNFATEEAGGYVDFDYYRVNKID
ncbi:glycoside hydrolase 43 family protein [Winogradskyella sp. SYSU M77433]|uniref:glycoside hydrolase family 43 protein n=1 Tax=Winogradskyella sp. SYSU M77433 TaxID=3042722 RepID=UPI00247FE282|nr:glycoside hydrolase 43 family protein [Winogradskyella sp. SYSU M77433]MDH7911156.1 glycoside hydrolase 43 family protein [Winogradskyella sp. SYSU M77433]